MKKVHHKKDAKTSERIKPVVRSSHMTQSFCSIDKELARNGYNIVMSDTKGEKLQ